MTALPLAAAFLAGLTSGWLLAKWRARSDARGRLQFSPRGFALVVERRRRERRQGGARS